MSAARLREAAGAIREDVAGMTDETGPFLLAVADWLEATAERIDAGRDPKHGGRRNHSWRGSRAALAVADAYLGGQP